MANDALGNFVSGATTEPAPIIHQSPISTSSRTVALLPINTPLPICLQWRPPRVPRWCVSDGHICGAVHNAIVFDAGIFANGYIWLDPL